MLIPVEGNKGLYRDKKTSAILNCSDSDYQKYLEVKSIKMNEVNKLTEMNEKVNEIEQLKSDVNEMKEMMKLLLKKMDSNS
jgi:hypothetical protein